MPLPDLAYFESKFDGLHSRITESDKEHAKCVADLEKRLAAHVASPCADTAKHVEDCHKDSSLKTWGLLSNIMAVIVALWALLTSHARNGGK